MRHNPKFSFVPNKVRTYIKLNQYMEKKLHNFVLPFPTFPKVESLQAKRQKLQLHFFLNGVILITSPGKTSSGS